MEKKIEHIGFIMDGNRTWAKQRFLPTVEGHRRGYENAKKIIRLIAKMKIPYASFWALSDDNIRTRSADEVKYLFGLLSHGILDVAKEAEEDGNKLIIIGDRTLLPEDCQVAIKKAENMTASGTGTTVLIAVGYGGQEEIVRAVNTIIRENLENITVDILKKYLESAQYPPPDLIIRTGGHIRHSGFLLFQSPYAEYFFSEKNWPDFDQEELQNAIENFKNSERKFGK